jgi:hypothetical protein
MAELKENIRRTLPQSPETTPSLQDNGARLDLARIPLPARTPSLSPPQPPLAIALPPSNGFDSIPRSVYWGLLGISALIFLIQIWNYALS